jgi:hypothetical protein
MKRAGWFFGLLVMLGVIGRVDAQGAESHYVMAGAGDGGSGTKATPFKSLREAEDASKPGDTIFLIPGKAGTVLDGGISLKPRQKLLGIESYPNQFSKLSPTYIAMTNTTDRLDGVCVELSESNEVSGIQFKNIRNHAIRGSKVNFSGSIIKHILVTGCIESEEVIYAIYLETDSGRIENVEVAHCVVQDGDDMGGVLVAHSGDSVGEYEFSTNTFKNLGGRAYMIWSRGRSTLNTRILDSSADNIGMGERNSDSILPRLWGSSEQTMLVKNYRYNNTKQYGNRSNTGLEVFLMGEPFRNEDEWCDGCKVTLEITDSVFENTITDGIQLTNYGSNSVMDLAIRNTKVIGANPQQGGGAISLIAQNQHNTGGKTKLLVENCDIIDSGKYGIAILDRSEEKNTSIVDFGGGALGSKGQNRIINSKEADAYVSNANPIAKHNWWGNKTPRLNIQEGDSSIEIDPTLSSDPRAD